jgi:hypothetical protein
VSLDPPAHHCHDPAGGVEHLISARPRRGLRGDRQRPTRLWSNGMGAAVLCGYAMLEIGAQSSVHDMTVNRAMQRFEQQLSD